MSTIGKVGNALYNFFVKDPVTYWTGKSEDRMTAGDAVAVYVGAALWPITMIAGCGARSGLLEPKDAGEPDVEVKSDTVQKDTGIPDTKVADTKIPDACQKTCEPGPCSSTLYVPANYPTIQDAINMAGKGDIIQIGAGNFEITNPIFMKDCNHIKGAGMGKTNLVDNAQKTSGKLQYMIIGSDKSSIQGISTIRINYGGATVVPPIKSTNVEITIKNSSANIFVDGNSKFYIEGCKGGEIELFDASLGSITSSSNIRLKLMGSAKANVSDIKQLRLKLWKKSYAKARKCLFDEMSASSAPPAQTNGVEIHDEADIDLGKLNDPGENTFINKSVHCEKSPDNIMFGYSILDNRTGSANPAPISAVGNFFEGEYAVSCNLPNGKYGTYEDILAHPFDPKNPESKVMTIKGKVDYSGAQKAKTTP